MRRDDASSRRGGAPPRARRRSGPLRRLTTLGRALVALGVILLAAAGIALAAAPGGDDRLGATVRYLQETQNLDGGFGQAAGQPSDLYATGWAAYALAAYDINPQDQLRPGGRDAVAYVVERLGALRDTADHERTLLVAIASCLDPRAFGGVDLVAPILSAQIQAGVHAGGVPQVAGGPPMVNATVFAILGLAGVRPADPAVDVAIARAAGWLQSEHVQKPDGSYNWNVGASPATGSSDMTASAIRGLRAAGLGETEAERRAWAYLRTVQNDDGGFRQTITPEVSNSMSTAWVLQAMWSAGVDPAGWVARDGRTPLDFLDAMQMSHGGMRHTPADAVASTWATAQVAPALAGRPLPIGCAPRRAPPDPGEERREPPATPPPAPSPGTQAGNGGFEDGDGQAIAGGGGRGAPRFSRPRAQSKGRRPGGVRRTARVHRRALHAARRDATAPAPAGPAAPRRRGAMSEELAAQAPPPTVDPVAASPPAPPLPAAEPSGADRDGDTVASARAGGGELAPGGSDDGDRAGRAPEVTGTLLGGGAALTSAGDDAEAAPGLTGARAGGDPQPAFALGLTGLLLVAAGFGTQVERRRPDEEQP